MNDVQKVLGEAKARISDPAKWCKYRSAQDARGLLVDFDSPSAIQFCGIGAVMACTSDAIIEERARKILREVVGAPSFSTWQDERARTHAEVMEAFDRAIEAAA